MSNVHAITPKGEKAALIVLEDATQVWTPDIDKAKTLKIGEPIPSSWAMRDGDYGKQAFPPREGKGGGGFKGRSPEMEQFVQERMDRRTAIMQATGGKVWQGSELPILFATADDIYSWLRVTATSGAAGAPFTPAAPGSSPLPEAHTATATPKVTSTAEEPPKGGVPLQGKGGTPPKGTCPPHGHVTDLKPDGKQMPAGKLRCTDCGAVMNEADVA